MIPPCSGTNPPYMMFKPPLPLEKKPMCEVWTPFIPDRFPFKHYVTLDEQKCVVRGSQSGELQEPSSDFYADCIPPPYQLSNLLCSYLIFWIAIYPYTFFSTLSYLCFTQWERVRKKSMVWAPYRAAQYSYILIVSLKGQSHKIKLPCKWYH